MIKSGMGYNIIYDSSTVLKKDIQSLLLNANLAFKIKTKIEEFSRDPLGFLWDLRKLQPKENNLYRIRIWEHRVILSIDFGNKIIIVHRIGLRKDVYK